MLITEVGLQVPRKLGDTLGEDVPMRTSPPDPTGGARRILVYGVTGSGKTTLAARLAARTGIPWHSVDDLTWEPGWVPIPEDEQRRRIAAICAQPSWILDTAYGMWLDLPLPRTELVVGLDYPRWFTFQRLLRRCLARVVDRRPICNGNRETLRGMLAEDSILRWHAASYARKSERLRQWEADPAAPRVLRFTSVRQTERWLSAA
jgi:adenylate kinase family enzyme